MHVAPSERTRKTKTNQKEKEEEESIRNIQKIMFELNRDNAICLKKK